jgi:hypothetical protein
MFDLFLRADTTAVAVRLVAMSVPARVEIATCGASRRES